jgi:uncharacterized protein YndB with AHSA1/START domain
MIMIAASVFAQNGKATTIKKTFSRSTSVETTIQADAEIVWSLLTNASDFPRWNSTILSIDGNIVEGEKIKLKAKLDPSRTFKIKIKDMEPSSKMVWGDAMGTRTFTMTKQDNGSLHFKMYEKIGGLMFPLFAKKIPSFDDAFEQYAADLKKEAELIQNKK